MDVNPVNWFELYVADMARARAFYEAVFAVTLEQLPVEGMEYWSFPMDDRRDGAGGALARMEGVAPGGGRVIRPKFSIGAYGFVALVMDTEGNTIGLHSMA